MVLSLASVSVTRRRRELPFQGQKPEVLSPGIPRHFELTSAQKVRSTVMSNLEAKVEPNQSLEEFASAIKSYVNHLESWLHELQVSRPEL